MEQFKYQLQRHAEHFPFSFIFSQRPDSTTKSPIQLSHTKWMNRKETPKIKRNYIVRYIYQNVWQKSAIAFCT